MAVGVCERCLSKIRLTNTDFYHSPTNRVSEVSCSCKYLPKLRILIPAPSPPPNRKPSKIKIKVYNRRV